MSASYYSQIEDSEGNVKEIAAAKLKTEKLIDGVGFDGSRSIIHYATCTQPGNVVAKTANVVDENGNNLPFSLVKGAVVYVKFSSSNTAQNPTLNINGTGPKAIKRYSTTSPSTSAYMSWNAGSVVCLVYDGTYWQMTNWLNTTYANYSLGQGYGTCATDEATLEKAVSLSNYTLSTGGIVVVKFTNAVPANATMNVNEKGAKHIYHRGAAITAGVIEAGDTATFIYSTYYHLISLDRHDVGGQANDATIRFTQNGVDIGSFTTDQGTTATIPISAVDWNAQSGTPGAILNKPGVFIAGNDAMVPGTDGFVPAPTFNESNKFLRGDGTWQSVIVSDAGFVHKEGIETISGAKAMTADLTLMNTGSATNATPYLVFKRKDGDDAYIDWLIRANDNGQLEISSRTTSTEVQMKLINSSSIKKALFTKKVEAPGFMVDGGTASQYLKANGDVGGVFTTGTDITPGPGNDGLVPSPTFSESNKFLRGDGTWAYPEMNFGCCVAESALANKVVNIQSQIQLVDGLVIFVMFMTSNEAENPTLNVNNTGAKPITRFLNATEKPSWEAGSVHCLVYSSLGDGRWIIINNYIEFAVCTEQSQGRQGLMPAPPIGAMKKIITGDKTWNTANSLLNVGSGLSNFNDRLSSGVVGLNGSTGSLSLPAKALVACAVQESGKKFLMEPLAQTGGLEGKLPNYNAKFPIGCPIYYHSDSQAWSGNGTYTNKKYYVRHESVDVRYTAVTGSNIHLEGGERSSVFLRVTLDNDGYWSPFYKEGNDTEIIVTSDDLEAGDFYIYLGKTNGTSGYTIQLEENHTLYYYDGTKLVDWATYIAEHNMVSSAKQVWIKELSDVSFSTQRTETMDPTSPNQISAVGLYKISAMFTLATGNTGDYASQAQVLLQATANGAENPITLVNTWVSLPQVRNASPDVPCYVEGYVYLSSGNLVSSLTIIPNGYVWTCASASSPTKGKLTVQYIGVENIVSV